MRFIKNMSEVTRYIDGEYYIEVRHTSEARIGEMTEYWFGRIGYGIMHYIFGLQGNTEDDEDMLEEAFSRGMDIPIK